MNDLYFMETFVSRLILTKKAYEDSGGASLIVRINLINFPPMEVEETARIPKEDHYYYEFKSGHTRHFSMKPKELVNRMKGIPVLIGVFKAGDTYPLCHIRTSLSGCACDLVARAEEGFRTLAFKGPFDLLDPGNMFAGELGADVCLTSLGRFVLTHYALGPGYFVSKNGPNGIEHEFTERERAGELFADPYRDNTGNAGNPALTTHCTFAGDLMKDVAGISLGAKYLAVGRPPPKPPKIPLVDPDLVVKPSKKSLRGKGKKGKKDDKGEKKGKKGKNKGKKKGKKK